MILDRLERERKQEEASEVVATFLDRRTSLSSVSSSCSSTPSSFASELNQWRCEGEEESAFLDAQEKLDYLRESWSMAVHQMGVTPELRSALVQLHRGSLAGGSPREGKARMREYIFAITKVFRKFALQQADFRALGEEDQTTAVMRSAPVFVQYIFARYLTARSAADKHDWLLLEEDDNNSINNIPNYDDEPSSAESLVHFCRRTDLFPGMEARDLAPYETLLESVSEPRLSKSHNYLVARACLFHLGHGEGASLRDEGRVRRCHEANLRCLERASAVAPSREELRDLLSRLDSAVAFFNSRADFFSGADQDTADVLLSTHALALPPSDRDRAWLREKVLLLREVADEIPFAATRAREAARFHYLGEEMSARCAVDALAVNLVRSTQ